MTTLAPPADSNLKRLTNLYVGSNGNLNRHWSDPPTEPDQTFHGKWDILLDGRVSLKSLVQEPPLDGSKGSFSSKLGQGDGNFFHGGVSPHHGATVEHPEVIVDEDGKSHLYPASEKQIELMSKMLDEFFNSDSSDDSTKMSLVFRLRARLEGVAEQYRSKWREIKLFRITDRKIAVKSKEKAPRSRGNRLFASVVIFGALAGACTMVMNTGGTTESRIATKTDSSAEEMKGCLQESQLPDSTPLQALDVMFKCIEKVEGKPRRLEVEGFLEKIDALSQKFGESNTKKTLIALAEQKSSEGKANLEKGEPQAEYSLADFDYKFSSRFIEAEKKNPTFTYYHKSTKQLIQSLSTKRDFKALEELFKRIDKTLALYEV